jgi:hypothetical protein
MRFGNVVVTFLAAVAAAGLAAPPRAGAAFVGNVERFDGTVKDTATWQEYLSSSLNGAITQNDVLTIATTGGGSISGDFTTKSLKVGVGGTVRADLRINSVAGAVSPALFLTDNSAGATNSTAFDNNLLELSFSSGGPGFNAMRGSGGSGNGQLFNPTFTPIVGTWYTLEIQRLSVSSAKFSAFAADGSSLGTTTLTIGGVPNDLFVSVGGGGGGSLSVDNVAVPEPGCVVIAGGLAAAAICLRRRARAKGW